MITNPVYDFKVKVMDRIFALQFFTISVFSQSFQWILFIYGMGIEPCLKFYAVPSPSQYRALRSQTLNVLCKMFTVSVSAKPLIDLNHVWYE